MERASMHAAGASWKPTLKGSGNGLAERDARVIEVPIRPRYRTGWHDAPLWLQGKNSCAFGHEESKVGEHATDVMLPAYV
jgi:hypothetical protein